MSQINANGIAIEYEERGDRNDDSLILIRGLGTQLIDWPVSLIDCLTEAGFRMPRASVYGGLRLELG